MCLRKSLCSIQFIFFTFFWSITVVFGQQNYPIQLNVQLIPPYSGYLPDYATAGNEKLKVILLQKDLTQPTYNVRLAMRLEGNGYTISTKPFFKGQPITLQAGVPVEISGSDIYDFLNSVNLDFTGLNKNTYEQGQALPEGYYSICFTAYDYNSPTPSQVSNQSCAQAWMTLSDPPFLNFPICGSTVQTNTPQNVVFGWTPMNTGSPNSANQTEYIFELWETRPDNNANPNNIVLSAPPVQTYTTDFTTFNYGMTETQLIAGMQYIWRVRAHDKSNRDLFKNQGYSQICTFIYGSIYDGLNLNLTANSQGISYRQGKVWWNGLSVFTQYTIQYRKVNGATSTWFTAYSTAPELKINDLEENTAYEAKVQGIANDGYIGQWSNTTTFTTPTKPIIACGDQIVPQPGQTIVPLAFATQGMRFKAGLFEVLVTSVQGGAGYFTGTGKVFVPMFGSLLNVTFDNVFVDDNQTVLSGNFYAVTKGITNWIKDWETDHPTPDYTYNGTVDSVKVNSDGTVTIYGSGGTVTQTPTTYPYTVTDANGTTYTVNSNGTVTTIPSVTLSSDQKNVYKLAMTKLKNENTLSKINQLSQVADQKETAFNSYAEGLLNISLAAPPSQAVLDEVIVKPQTNDNFSAGESTEAIDNYIDAELNYAVSKVCRSFAKDNLKTADYNLLANYLYVGGKKSNEYISQELQANKPVNDIAEEVKNELVKFITQVIEEKIYTKKQ